MNDTAQNSMNVRSLIAKLVEDNPERPIAKREVHNLLQKQFGLDPVKAGYTLTNTSQRLIRQGILTRDGPALWRKGPKFEMILATTTPVSDETPAPAPAKKDRKTKAAKKELPAPAPVAPAKKERKTKEPAGGPGAQKNLDRARAKIAQTKADKPKKGSKKAAAKIA